MVVRLVRVSVAELKLDDSNSRWSEIFVTLGVTSLEIEELLARHASKGLNSGYHMTPLAGASGWCIAHFEKRTRLAA